MHYRIETTCYREHQSGIEGVRCQVFIEEQGIDPAEEWDEHDASAIFVVALDDNNQVLGTARLLKSGKIGRMAVLATYRHQGIGSTILQHLLMVARQQGFARIHLYGQKTVLEFYAWHGFTHIGPPHVEVGIPHQSMQLQL